MIVRLAGGLGNQFFQYAFGRAYEEETGEKVSFDTWAFYRDTLRNYELDNYNIKKNEKRFLRILLCNIVWEVKTHIGHTAFLEKLLKIECEREAFMIQEITKQDVYAIGFWHNKDYFASYIDILKSELSYKGVLSKAQKEVIRKMSKEKSVAMHIRRTDHLSNTCTKIYENLDKNYYLSAIEYLRKTVGDIQVYVFSDDIKWCKKEYADMKNLIFIDENISTNHHIDMELMRNCKYFIIANSTFSWWGACLANHKEKIIISPKKWLVDAERDKKIIAALMDECILM